MIPARWSRLSCCLFALLAVVFVVPAVAAQTRTGSVALTGSVSETVALAVLPSATQDNVKMDVLSSGNTVRITLSGNDANPAVIRVPVIVRSNSSFKISATVASNAAVLTQLAVTDAQATGRLVSPDLVNRLNVPPRFDLRSLHENPAAANPSSFDLSSTFLLVSGPRVSLGGTLVSPNNALRITLLIGAKPQTIPGWSIHLTFVATAESLAQ